MILVTGASGTVGREVVKALAGRGGRVRAGFRSRPQNLPSDVESVALDYEKPETIPPALAGVDTLFLLSNTVEPEKKVVDAAKRAGVHRIVKLSVFGAAEEAYSFARWHRAVEKHIEASGLAWTFLRPNGYMQNVVNYMAGTIRSQSAIYSSAGDSAISHVDVRDVGAVAARVLTGDGHESRAYEITGPTALRYDEIAAALSQVLGRAIRYVPVTHELAKQGAMKAGTPESYADALVDLNRHYAEGRGSRVTDTVRRLTGKDPIPFLQFAQEHAAQLR